MEIKDLEVYTISREISEKAWPIYTRYDWQDRKIIGDQWITAIDSVGANIAEGFGRFHYLDKNKFNYNARGSLFESEHWTNLLYERNKITKEEYDYFVKQFDVLRIKLNNYIKSTKEQVTKDKDT